MTDEPEKTNGRDKALEESEARAQEYLDLAKRIQADFDNYRRRTAKENEEFRRFAVSDILSELLTIADDIERALSHADGDSADGIKMIRTNLMKLMQSRGITEIDASGTFDPNCHEALCICEGDDDNKITEVFQKGYMMDNRVLRCSKVRVTKTKEKEEGE